MPVSRLKGMAGIGVDRMGNLADQAQDAQDGAILRLENLGAGGLNGILNIASIVL